MQRPISTILQRTSESIRATKSSAEIQGQTIHYLTAGAGPPVLLVHGLLGGSFCWRFTLPVLAMHFTTIAVDLAGLGSCDDEGVDCSMSCQAERLFGFVQSKGWRELVVIGCSFGGAVAMMLAARAAKNSSRIRQVVLSAPVNPWSHFGEGRIRLLTTTLGGQFLRTVLPISHPCHRIAVRRMYGDPSRMPADAVEGYRRSVLRRGRAQNVLTALRSWSKDVNLLQKLIPQIEVPTLLVWGDHDQTVDPNSAKALQQYLPNAELKLIPGAGHLPFEEMPQEFNRIVLEFLNRTPFLSIDG